MTDRYTELVKQAYEAQQAREGDGYVKLTTELTGIDADLEALSAKREATCAALEAMDDAVEAAKEALDAYFAGREEDDHPLTRDHMYEHDEDELGPKASYSDDVLFDSIDPILTEEQEDEYASAKANGALS